MKILIFILILTSFLHSTVMPIDLTLIILICRSYLNPGRSNLYLAFVFGLLTAHLSLTNLGLQGIIYLFLVQTSQAFAKIKYFTHPFLVVLLTFVLLSLNALSISLIYRQSVQIFPLYLYHSLFALPVFYLLKIWEENFRDQKDIKLKFN